MAKVARILQPFGIGDVIFTQSIAVHFLRLGYEIEWVVFDHFLPGLQKAYPLITFLPYSTADKDALECKDMGEVNGYLNVPIRFSDTIRKVLYENVMRAKYDMYGLDWQNWRVHAMWKRDGQKEYDLRIALQLPPKYNLINRTFGSNSQLKAAIHVDNGLPNIDMRTIEGFSLFDWAYVIENAAEIHTVSTSIIYLLEMLELKAECVHLYPRKPIENDFRNVDYILERHEYEYHL